MEEKLKIINLIKEFGYTKDYLMDSMFIEEAINLWLKLGLINEKEAYLVYKCIQFLVD